MIWLGLSVAGVFVVMSGVAVAVGAPVSIVPGREVVESVVLGVGDSMVELRLRAELMVVKGTITVSPVPMPDPSLPLIPLNASQHVQFSIIALASKSELRTDINTNY